MILISFPPPLRFGLPALLDLLLGVDLVAVLVAVPLRDDPQVLLDVVRRLHDLLHLLVPLLPLVDINDLLFFFKAAFIDFHDAPLLEFLGFLVLLDHLDQHLQVVQVGELLSIIQSLLPHQPRGSSPKIHKGCSLHIGTHCQHVLFLGSFIAGSASRPSFLHHDLFLVVEDELHRVLQVIELVRLHQLYLVVTHLLVLHQRKEVLGGQVLHLQVQALGYSPLQQ